MSSMGGVKNRDFMVVWVVGHHRLFLEVLMLAIGYCKSREPASPPLRQPITL